MYCWLVKVITYHGIQSLHEEGGVTFDECLLLHSCCDDAVLCMDIRATTVRCQPSVCLSDQQHRIGNCVVCWAIVTCLDIAGKRCVL